MKRLKKTSYKAAIFFAASILATTAFANACNHLKVTVNPHSGWGIDGGSIDCHHGKIIADNSPTSVTLDIVDGGSFGPDCTMNFSPLTSGAKTISKGTKLISIRASQDLCALAAGDVSFSYTPNNYEITSEIRKGSFPDGQGTINIYYVTKK